MFKEPEGGKTHIKDLEKILDETIAEAYENEPKTQEIDKETIEEYERMEENCKNENIENQVTNIHLLDAITVQNNAMSSIMLGQSMLKKQEEQEESLVEARIRKIMLSTESILGFVKEESIKIKLLKIALWVLIGVLIGMQDHVWISSIGDIGNGIWNFFKMIK